MKGEGFDIFPGINEMLPNIAEMNCGIVGKLRGRKEMLSCVKEMDSYEEFLSGDKDGMSACVEEMHFCGKGMLLEGEEMHC